MGCVSSIEQIIDPDHINLSHFSVERVVGKGGFGKWFAVKALSKEEVIKTQNSAMILNERNLLVTLKHPLFHAFQDEHFCYVVMDLCQGGDLRFQLKHSPTKTFSENQTKFYIATLISVLQYLHGERVIHRDIKPDESGYARLTDFGISERVGEDGISTAGSGTRAYMAPEILKAGHAHTYEVDTYALAVVTFEFLTGGWPFPFTGSASDADLDLDPVPAVSNVPELSETAKDFIIGCLAIDPSARTGAHDGIGVLKNHPWYDKFDWDSFDNKKMEAPFIPNDKQANCDTGKVDLVEAFGVTDSERPKILPESQVNLISMNKELFKGYNYNTDVFAADESKIDETKSGK